VLTWSNPSKYLTYVVYPPQMATAQPALGKSCSLSSESLAPEGHHE
jgi:hypothetical protein